MTVYKSTTILCALAMALPSVQAVDISPNMLGLKSSAESRLAFAKESAPDPEDQAPRTATALPSSVDRSAEKYFPPIATQKVNACVAYSVDYYMLTYQWARKKDKDAVDAQLQMQPLFVYNLTNEGVDQGSNPRDNVAVLKQHGCALWKDFAPAETNYTTWADTTQIWSRALDFRISKSVIVSTLDEVRKKLHDGNLLSVSLQVIRDHSDATPDFAWNLCPTLGTTGTAWVNPVYIDRILDHQVTIVGYDDNIVIDLNYNGVQDPGEPRGALKMANSWGSGHNTTTDGFFWVPYNAITNNLFDSFYIKLNLEKPSAIASVKLRTERRSDLRLGLGWGPSDSTAVSDVSWLATLQSLGGAHAFQGWISMDASDLADKNRVIIAVKDRTPRKTTRIMDAQYQIGDRVYSDDFYTYDNSNAVRYLPSNEFDSKTAYVSCDKRH